MKEKALEVLKKLSENNYESYLVGGYPRDLILGRKTNDIDICTSATPKEILEIFDDVIVSDMQYGSVVIVYKGCKFDTTTFRKEIKYESNRKPVKIKYIKDIKKDLLRRDFTINTLCIDKDGNLLDILNIRSDLDNKLLKTVGNPRYRIKEDSLRILRCIRFATILDFDIEKKTKYFLTKYSYLLKSLSINRKKEELDKIFLSKNKERGRRLLLELNLTNALDLDKLATITMCTDLTGIWCQLEVDDIYPFTKVEKEQMSKLRELLKYDKIDNYLLYKYGLYLCTVYAEIKGIPRRKINTMYSKLPILTRRDINVTGEEISMILNKPPGKYIKDILDDIEVNILNSSISNDKEEITKYIKDKYKLLIGDRTAEQIKLEIGSAVKGSSDKTFEVRGRDLVTGLPHTITITSNETELALRETCATIVKETKHVLEQTPPELAADIVSRGIFLTGGGALLTGLDRLLESELNVPVFVADDALNCVANGCGVMLENLHYMK